MAYDNFTFYKNCTQNMTVGNYKENKRCAAPLAWQQWGLKFNATDMVGLEAAVKSKLSSQLAGVGVFTLDGVIAQVKEHRERLWHKELIKLNTTYQIPCSGTQCMSKHS